MIMKLRNIIYSVVAVSTLAPTATWMRRCTRTTAQM